MLGERRPNNPSRKRVIGLEALYGVTVPSDGEASGPGDARKQSLPSVLPLSESEPSAREEPNHGYPVVD